MVERKRGGAALDEPENGLRDVTIRRIDDVTWGFLRGEATRRRVTIAAMLRLIVTDWCDRRDDERRKAS